MQPTSALGLVSGSVNCPKRTAQIFLPSEGETADIELVIIIIIIFNMTREAKKKY